MPVTIGGKSLPNNSFLFLYLFVADDRYNLTNFPQEFYECHDRISFARCF